MKRLHWIQIFSLCLLTIFPCASSKADDTGNLISEKAIATRIFGKVEVLKTDSSNWEFLKKDTQLSSDALIRMPPISLLRIREKNGVALPAFHGSRELLVSQFIAEGKDRIAKSKGKRLNTHLDGEMAIDILPTGNPNVAKSNLESHMEVPKTLKVLTAKLPNLRYLLKNPSDALKSYTRNELGKIVEHQQSASKLKGKFTIYPGKNILQAQYLFEILMKEMQEAETQNGKWKKLLQGINANMQKATNDFVLWQDSDDNRTALGFMVLYGQMLRSTGIKVDFMTNSENELFLIFDSGRDTDEIGQITANRSLVYLAKKNLWIPINVSDMNNNFTHAWYKGSQIANEE